MSDKFEDSINLFYEKERIANTQLLDLSQESKVSNHDLANNLDFVIKHLVLLSRVSLKNFHKILEKQEIFEQRINSLESSTQELLKYQPLTSKSARNLISEISRQPKEIEQKALDLLSKLEEKILKIEKVVEEVAHWVG